MPDTQPGLPSNTPLWKRTIGPHHRGGVLALAIAMCWLAPSARANPAPSPEGVRASPSLIDALGAEDRGQVERAVAAIVGQPPHDADPDALFAAARACEDKLLDPGRAVVVYERIVAQHPTARIAAMAARRVAALRELVGAHGERAAQAAELAQLVASSDALPVDAVVARAERLATATWPGAATAALWLADWLRRTQRFALAQVQYAGVIARWPGQPEAEAALRGAAGCALDARAWSLAEALANRLPGADPGERRVRDDLIAAAERGQRRTRWYATAWVVILGAFGALIGSLGQAIARTPRGARRAMLRPPIEVVFLAPVALVLVGVAFTAHRLIAPAVAVISAGGVALSWLSGATLDGLRARGRLSRLRTALHVGLCLAGVAGLAYVALTRDELIDMVIETVRFGPES